VPNPQPNNAALRAALEFLRARDRFVAELRAHLASKRYEAGDVETVVQLLIERRLIEDDRTTRNLIEQRSGKRAIGTGRIRLELESLGADPAAVERYIDEIGQTESERALDALRAKYKTGAERAKAGRFLIGRGFDEDAVESALDAFCG